MNIIESRFKIGQKVKVNPSEYGGWQNDWQDPTLELFVSGVAFNRHKQELSYTIIEKYNDGTYSGETDGFSESDLRHG